jgi:hypothetical protein
MSRLQRTLRGGAVCRGGIVSYPLEQLHQEVAYIAYHFHWAVGDILEFPHPERRRWVGEIARINTAMMDED